jgi:hypothetical protein
VSSNRNDKPTAGHNPVAEYTRSGDRQTPEPGRVFVRNSSGTTLLKQTWDLFRGKKR